MSMLAALFSFSNVLFWRQAGYFDVASESKPLLHTWSLGVEEQFYIFFPLFLMAVRFFLPRSVKAALWMITIVSLVLATFFASRSGNTFAFYLAPLRLWELTVGTMAAQAFFPKIEGQIQRNLASLVGLALILASATTYTAATSFPGLTALPPVIGTALVILAGETGSSLVGRFLSWRPVVFIGLISYSLYLWHWPIKVFLTTSLALQAAPLPFGSILLKAVVFFGSILIATLSWRFVEKPFRQGRWRLEGRPLFAWSLGAASILASLGFIALYTRGLPKRFSTEVVRVDEYSAIDPGPAWREGQCFLNVPRTFIDADIFSKFDKAVCLHDDPVRKHYLLYGDSRAADKYQGFSTIFPELNISLASVSSCPPLIRVPADSSVTCKRMSDYVFNDYLANHKVDAVLLSAHWHATELPELGRTLDWLHQHGLLAIVIGPGIEYKVPLPKLIAISIRDVSPKTFVDSFRQTDWLQLDHLMASLARAEWKVQYISVYDTLCAAQVKSEAAVQPEPVLQCPIYGSPGVPILRDTDHFTSDGSVLFAEAIRSRGELP
jgi:hypothetical protein